MDSEYGVSAHNLYVSIFEVKRIVASSYLLLSVFYILTELRWGQVGYRGDGKRGGRGCAGCNINKRLGQRVHVIEDGRGFDILEGGGGGVRYRS